MKPWLLAHGEFPEISYGWTKLLLFAWIPLCVCTFTHTRTHTHHTTLLNASLFWSRLPTTFPRLFIPAFTVWMCPCVSVCSVHGKFYWQPFRLNVCRCWYWFVENILTRLRWCGMVDRFCWTGRQWRDRITLHHGGFPGMHLANFSVVACPWFCIYM